MVPPPTVLQRRASSAGAVAACVESIATVVLCVAVVAGPLALGGTPAWACFGLEAAMATAAMLWILARPRPLAALGVPLTVAALVLVQFVPLPDGLLTVISPVSAGAWRVAHEGMPAAWGRISVTPAATAAAACRLLLGITTILVVSDLATDPRRRRWVFGSLAAVGVIVWLLAALVPNDPIDRKVYGVFSLRGPMDYWKTPDLEPVQTSGVGYLEWVQVGDQRYLADAAITGTGLGPYIYANHFANVMCLTVPALCGIWLTHAGPSVPRLAVAVAAVAVVVAGLWANHIWAASRAGTAALLFGFVVYQSLIAESRWLRRLLTGIAAVGLFAAVALMGVLQGPLRGIIAVVPAAWQPLAARALVDARMVAARIAGRMFLESPLAGTGLGSYGDLFPRLYGRERIMFFAHNDHAQLWAEAGLIGMAVWGLAGGALVHRFILFSRERAAGRSIDAAAWAALAAGAAHSVFDWNVHVPANAFLACVIVGLALSSMPRRAVAPAGRDRPRGFWLATAVFGAAIIGATATLARDAALARPRAELRRAITAVRLARSHAEHARAVDRLTAAIAGGEAACAGTASDWRLPMLLGQAHLHLDEAARERATRVVADPSPERPAAGWFRRARLASPACRGLPEPVPADVRRSHP